MAESHHLNEEPSRGTQHGRRASTTSGGYNTPGSTHDLDSPDGARTSLNRPHPQNASGIPLKHERNPRHSRRASMTSHPGYDVPDTYTNLDETADVSPIQNPHEEPIHRFRSLEQTRAQEQEFVQEQKRHRQPPEPKKLEEAKYDVSRLLTQLYTISYLILFSILGTLARLGLQALTNYPGTPIIFTSIWPNFAGCLVMGFLSEDRMLFREAQPPTPSPSTDEEETTNSAPSPKQTHAALKKTIPLYIGLATGFCGSLTSFSAFMRDTFLALANDLPTSTSTPLPPRNGGYSFLALLSIPLITLALSLSALFLGAHLAIALAPIMPSLHRTPHAWADRAAVPLAWGCWLGAVLLAALPPAGHAAWRGEVLFALVFAPLGCLVRFVVSLWLNGRVAAFPVGTFVVNVVGTAVLAAAWDLAHSGAVGGGAGEGVGVRVTVGCQVLAGVQDGFCGCLTTVSTWVGELAALRRRHAYVYGGASVLGGLAVVVAVMGGLRWSEGYESGACG